MTDRKVIQEDGLTYVELKEGDKIQSKGQQDGFKKHSENQKEYNNAKEIYGEFYFKERMDNKRFKINSEEGSDLARLIYSLTYMDYDRILKTENGGYIDKSVLFKIMNVDRKIFNKWFDKMIDDNIFMYIDNSYIAIMSEEYIKGNLPDIKSRHYTKLYNDTIREIYEANKGKSMNAMGLIFKMIPYIHKDTNAVCINPKCKDSDRIKYITAGQIAKELGYSDKILQMEKMLSKFTLSNGEPIILFVSNGERFKDKVLINPIVMFGGNSKDLPQIHNLFKSFSIQQGKIKG